MTLSFDDAYRRILDVKNSPKEGLLRMAGMLDPLGNPERVTPCIHIAGTNGKGSTASFCDAILRAHGRKVGRSTSPHLSSVRERIVIDGAIISEAEFVQHEAEIFRAVEPLTDRPTFFERMCAMTFLSFAQHEVDIGVVEVGLGGRLDGTNVIDPLVSVICPVSLDHTPFLGDTLGKIAAEKAGIIKAGRPVVIGAQPVEAADVLTARATQLDAPVIRLGGALRRETDDQGRITVEVHDQVLLAGARPSLRGAHQADNAAVASAACALALGDAYDAARAARAVESTCWPGRYETVQSDPLIILDGAHNAHAAHALRETLAADARWNEPTCIVAGATKGHDVGEFAAALGAPDVPVLATRASAPRSIGADEVAAGYRRAGYRRVEQVGVGEALSVARRRVGPKGAVLVTGSLYLVGQLRQLLRGGPLDPALDPF